MRWIVDNKLVVVIVVLGIGITVNFVLLVPALGKLSQQARAGQQAKQTQCDRDPVSQKLALAAYAVRMQLPPEARVTREELERFKRTRPRDCPQ